MVFRTPYCWGFCAKHCCLIFPRPIRYSVLLPLRVLCGDESPWVPPHGFCCCCFQFSSSLSPALFFPVKLLLIFQSQLLILRGILYLRSWSESPASMRLCDQLLGILCATVMCSHLCGSVSNSHRFLTNLKLQEIEGYMFCAWLET